MAYSREASGNRGIGITLRVAPDAGSHPEPISEGHLDIVILGDFQGLDVGTPGLMQADRIGSLVSVDPENLDNVIAQLAPRLDLRLNDDAHVELTIREIEGFHPDRLLDQVPHLASLRAVRDRAGHSKESSAALRAAAGVPDVVAKPGPASPKPRATPKPPPAGSVLDWILDEPTSREPAAPSELDQFVDEVVAPHLVQEPDESRAALVRDLDAAMITRMRQLLHHPGFQALEALWRGTALLLQRLEVGPSLRVHLLQATRSGLLAASRAEDPRRSELSRALRGLPQGNGPTLVVVDLSFDASDEDLRILTSLAKTAQEHEAILIAAAAPGLVGLDGRGEPEGPWDVQAWSDPAWLAFRESPQADSVALAIPRILLRPPYGEDGESCQKLDFEELTVPPQRGELLWGNPAFACALLLGEAVTASGWPLRLPDPPEIPGLPVHSWRDGERSGLVPCTEWAARSDVAGALRKSGPMVFVPAGHGDIARLMGFRMLGLGG